MTFIFFHTLSKWGQTEIAEFLADFSKLLISLKGLECSNTASLGIVHFNYIDPYVKK